MPVTGPSVQNYMPPIEDAVWWAQMPRFEALEASRLPGFCALGFRGRGFAPLPVIRIVGRALGNPIKSLRALRAGKSLRELARFFLLLDSAALFGVMRLWEPDMKPSPFTAFLPAQNRVRDSSVTNSIAAVIITQNRSSKLQIALDTVGGLASKTVVVDGGSTDDTVEVAEAAGALVVRRPFDHNFARQRNAGVKHVKDSAWVIRIDDDECFSPGLAEFLHEVIPSAQNFDCIFIPETTFGPERWNPPALKDIVMRSNLHFRGPVHESPTWNRPLFCPLSTPHLQNHKTLREYLESARLYCSMRPDQFPDGFLEHLERQLSELDSTADG